MTIRIKCPKCKKKYLDQSLEECELWCPECNSAFDYDVDCVGWFEEGANDPTNKPNPYFQ